MRKRYQTEKGCVKILNVLHIFFCMENHHERNKEIIFDRKVYWDFDNADFTSTVFHSDGKL